MVNDRMKILLIHNFHREGSSSGDDQVFISEAGLLEKHGNRVIRFTVSNDEFDAQGAVGKLVFLAGMLWSNKYYKILQQIIDVEKPDIVHVHTFFPLLSPSVLYAAKRMRIPVVATLHDTRLICPCATSLRGETICNDCGDGHYFRMFRYGCFKKSRIKSLIVACIFKIHRIKKSFYDQIDRYICLNDNQIRLLVSIGFDKKKIIKKYNFVPDIEIPPNAGVTDDIPERFVCVFGRIGVEKGISFLMRAWDGIEDIPLVVVGGGPEEKSFGEWAKKKKNVYYLGYKKHDSCLNIVNRSAFIVFPSIWYEGCSMVQVEAMSLGKAIIATDLGFSSESVSEGYNGYKFQLGDILGFTNCVRKLWNDPEKCLEMGKNARKEYERKYEPESNYRQIMECYKGLLGQDQKDSRCCKG